MTPPTASTSLLPDLVKESMRSSIMMVGPDSSVEAEFIIRAGTNGNCRVIKLPDNKISQSLERSNDMPDHQNTTPQCSSGEFAIEFRKSKFTVNSDDLIVKEYQLFTPRLDRVNLELVSRYKSIEHADAKLIQEISKFSITEYAKTSPIIVTQTNVSIGRKT